MFDPSASQQGPWIPRLAYFSQWKGGWQQPFYESRPQVVCDKCKTKLFKRSFIYSLTQLSARVTLRDDRVWNWNLWWFWLGFSDQVVHSFFLVYICGVLRSMFDNVIKVCGTDWDLWQLRSVYNSVGNVIFYANQPLVYLKSHFHNDFEWARTTEVALVPGLLGDVKRRSLHDVLEGSLWAYWLGMGPGHQLKHHQHPANCLTDSPLGSHFATGPITGIRKHRPGGGWGGFTQHTQFSHYISAFSEQLDHGRSKPRRSMLRLHCEVFPTNYKWIIHSVPVDVKEWGGSLWPIFITFEVDSHLPPRSWTSLSDISISKLMSRGHTCSFSIFQLKRVVKTGSNLCTASVEMQVAAPLVPMVLS